MKTTRSLCALLVALLLAASPHQAAAQLPTTKAASTKAPAQKAAKKQLVKKQRIKKQADKDKAVRNAKKKAAAAKKAEQRKTALQAIMASLNVGPGATIADIGAGKGRDTWVFADIVGKLGTVYSEEIMENNVKATESEAKRRGLTQVHTVLGLADTPNLPHDTIDVAYMHYVYHHFTQPRPMLRELWKALKPGGYLVIVDRHRGTLQDWVPREKRGTKHFWLAETTVVREAREEGFSFVRCAEDCWPTKDQFVLVFQRPTQPATACGDPDPFLPLDVDRTGRFLDDNQLSWKHPLFIALGEGRKLIEPIMKHVSGSAAEVILEEWATQKNERPALPAGISMPSTLTEKGDPHLKGQPFDIVFFLDSYHLLFHQKQLLAKIREHLTPDGQVVILDRNADKPLSRRLASHCRKIPEEMVIKEMEASGFTLVDQLSPPAKDRFALIFEKSP